MSFYEDSIGSWLLDIMDNRQEEPTVAVSLTVKNTAAALEFYSKAFGAVELYRIPTPDGDIAQAEFTIGNTTFYISGESEEWHAYAMADGAMASSLLVILTDSTNDSYEQATGAGAEGLSDPQDQFWGMRTAIVKDPFGYRWSFREVVEKLSLEEIMERAKKVMGE